MEKEYMALVKIIMGLMLGIIGLVLMFMYLPWQAVVGLFLCVWSNNFDIDLKYQRKQK